MGSLKKFEVPADSVCWHCNTADFNFECTDELTPVQGLIGQDRAIDAIQFGLEVGKRGYNLFVTGLTGTGKASAIQRHLRVIIDEHKTKGVQFPIHDWCYAYNFVDPDKPGMLKLPPGRGKRLQHGLRDLLTTLQEQVPKLFAAEDYSTQKKAIEEEGRLSYQTTMQELEKDAKAENFGIQFGPTGINVFPITSEGKQYESEAFAALPEDEQDLVQQKRNRLLETVRDTMDKLRSIEKETQDRVKNLDLKIAEVRLTDLFHELAESFADFSDVKEHLDSLKAFSLDNLNLFREEHEETVPGPPQVASQFGRIYQTNPFLPFEINVLVDNSGTDAAPIIIESNPTWGNLFGRIERRAFMGTYLSDHTMLKSGSIHQANGGYLVLNARDLLMNPGVWEGLKRIIRNKETRLEDPSEQFGLVAPQGLRPQPVPWDAKVIVTGDEALYRMLSTYDREDFWEMFKVKAEFDSQIDLTPENVAAYCAFICTICHAEGLLHADRSGVARVVEYSARLVSDQTKLSSRFGQLQDVLIEADYWARKDGAPLITSEHVKNALEKKIHRLNLMEEKLRQLIAEGTLMVDVTGEVVGQMNGLVVYDLGDFSSEGPPASRPRPSPEGVGSSTSSGRRS